MDWDDDIAARLMAAIAALPPEEQSEAVHALLGSVIKPMPMKGLREVRAEIAAMYEQEPLEIIETTLDMIDGQIALREIAGRSRWR